MRVVIVGGGVLGTMHAWQALSRGHQVVQLEREADARGASVRNFGLVWADGDSLRYYPAYAGAGLDERQPQAAVAREHGMQLLMVQRRDSVYAQTTDPARVVHRAEVTTGVWLMTDRAAAG
jgi:glycine/D-amino acid oxidase-like deaminating enzyme